MLIGYIEPNWLKIIRPFSLVLALGTEGEKLVYPIFCMEYCDPFSVAYTYTEKLYFLKMTNTGSSASGMSSPDEYCKFDKLTCHFDESVHHFDQPRLVVIHDEPRFAMLINLTVSKLLSNLRYSSGE
jgi:hypothetical protein